MKKTAADGEHAQQNKHKTACTTSQLTAANQSLLFTGPLLGAFHSPPTISREDILLFQSVAGNHAVNRLVDQQRAFLKLKEASIIERSSLQRQGTGGDQPTRESRTQSLDAELDAILAKIPSPPQVPAFEAITSTTAGEYSVTEWEEAMQRNWRRDRLTFTQTARRVAGTEEANRPVSTEGPRVTPPVPYAKRWTLNLIANNYHRGKRLQHVNNFLKKGSPFEQAQAAESDRVINVQDPTGEMMRSNIIDAIFGLFAALPEGQIGELVVYFSGHGINGVINGVDWGFLSPGDLESLANFARDWNVHIVYILDSCRAGGFVILSQGAAIKEAEKRFKKLPADQQQILRQKANAARALVSGTYAINQETVKASEVLRYIKSYTPGNRMKMMRSFNT